MVKQILEEIEGDVSDIKSKKFDYVSTSAVPSRHDTTLTFERGENKVGKVIDTCVLYVDIRNSVELNRTHQTLTMGRLYSVFAKSMLKLARHHQGVVRNIIGDRVMIVFPSENCFTNAVDCAISINHVSDLIINKVFSDVNFKCGIGIDYGTLKVVKVGLHRRGSEHIDNKNLVWVGYPANIASRLTDVANKTVQINSVNVLYYPYSFSHLFPVTFGGYTLPKTPKMYQDEAVTKTHSLEDFAQQLSYNSLLGVCYSGGKLISFTKDNSTVHYPPILMTEVVYNGFKSANSSRIDVTAAYWKEIEKHNIKNVSSKVFGGTVIWKI
jgi:adenylate cyclase